MREAGIPDRRWILVAVAAVVVLVVAGLVTGSLLRGGGEAPAGDPAREYDPPTRFDGDHVVALPRDLTGDAAHLPVVLLGTDLVIGGTDGLSVVDTRTGTETHSVPAADEASGAGANAGSGAGSGAGAGGSGGRKVVTTPVAAVLGGRPAVVAAFATRVAGHGTTPGHDAVAVLAVDRAGYAPTVRTRIDLPVDLTGAADLREAEVAGVEGTVVVVVARTGTALTPTTYGLDVAAGTLRWQAPGLDAALVDGALAVGTLAEGGTARPSARRVADGSVAWSAGAGTGDLSVWPAGRGRVAVSDAASVTGDGALRVLDTATGAAVGRTEPVPRGVRCLWDDRSVLVCTRTGSGTPWAAGYDPSSGQRRWVLPDPSAGRVAPQVTAAFHGLVYGTTDNGAVLLDGLTGADRPGDPGVAPDLVGTRVGVVAPTTSALRATAWPAIS